jgi:hypothetical protein
MAQDEFAKDKAMGKYDAQNMPIEVNLWLKLKKDII